MTLRNYMYNLENGQTQSYQNGNKNYTRQGDSSTFVESSTERAGSATSAYSTGSTSSTSSAGSAGSLSSYSSSSSAGSATGIGSVGDLSFSTLLDLYETGNLTAEELVSGLKAKRAKNVVQATNGNRVTYSFEFNGKKYTISCTKAASASQIDNNAVETYTAAVLKNSYKFTDEQIKQYFDVAETKNGQVTKYALKEGGGYKNANELRNAIFTEYKNRLILNNLLHDTNRISDDTDALKTTVDKNYRPVTINIKNYNELAEQINKMTNSADIAKLKQEALDKFISDFSQGNLAYGQVRSILDAIGVKNFRSQQSNGKYVLTFEFNGKKYTVSCNIEAAKSGKDLLVTGKSVIGQFYQTEEGQLVNTLMNKPSSLSDEQIESLENALKSILADYDEYIADADKDAVGNMIKCIAYEKVNRAGFGEYSYFVKYNAEFLLDRINEGNLDIKLINTLLENSDTLGLGSQFKELLQKFQDEYSKGETSYNQFVISCKSGNDSEYVSIFLQQVLNEAEGVLYNNIEQWSGEEVPKEQIDILETYLCSKYPDVEDLIYSNYDSDEIFTFFVDMANRYVAFAGSEDGAKKADDFFCAIDAQASLLQIAFMQGEDVQEYINANLVREIRGNSGRRSIQKTTKDLASDLGLPPNIDISVPSQQTREDLLNYYSNNPEYSVEIDGYRITVFDKEENEVLYVSNTTIYVHVKDSSGYFDESYYVGPRGIELVDSSLTDYARTAFSELIDLCVELDYKPDTDAYYSNYTAMTAFNHAISSCNSDVMSMFIYYDGDKLRNFLEKQSIGSDSIIMNSMLEYCNSFGIYTDDIVKNMSSYLYQPSAFADAIQRLTERFTQEDYIDIVLNPDSSDFEQNRVGDCWYLAALISLDSTPKGKEFLNEIVGYDSKTNTFSVVIQGEVFKYSISELAKSREFSTGNYKIRALEKAANDLLLKHPEIKESIYGKNNLLEGGFIDLFAKIFTGKDSCAASDDIYNLEDSKLEELFWDNMLTVGTNTVGEIIDQKTGQKIPIYDSHAYSVVGFDGKNVQIVNPWNSKKIITISLKDFRNTFEYIGIVNLKEFISNAKGEESYYDWEQEPSDVRSHYTSPNEGGQHSSMGYIDMDKKELERYGMTEEYINGYRFIVDSNGNVVDGEVGINWKNGTGRFVDRNGNAVDLTVTAYSRATADIRMNKMAEKYAEETGLSYNDARFLLENMFTDPNDVMENCNIDFINNLIESGITPIIYDDGVMFDCSSAFDGMEAAYSGDNNDGVAYMEYLQSIGKQWLDAADAAHEAEEKQKAAQRYQGLLMLRKALDEYAAYKEKN